MFVYDCERRKSFITEKIGGFKNLKLLADNFMEYMAGATECIKTESDDYSTDGYVPGVVNDAFETEEGHLVIEMIVNKELKEIYASPEVQEVIGEIKDTANANPVLGWSEQELDDYDFIKGRALMFEAVNNEIIYFNVIDSMELDFVFECMETVENLLCKEDE